MKFRRSIALGAAIALPLTGIVIAGGVELASGTPNTTIALNCNTAIADPANSGTGTANTGGTTFDTTSLSGNPGSSAAYLDANPGETAKLGAAALIHATAVELVSDGTTAPNNNAEVAVGETFKIAGQTTTYTVTSDHTALFTVSPDYITFTPQLTAAASSGALVTVQATPTTSNVSLGDLSSTAGSNTLTGTAGDFTSVTVGQAVSGAWLNGSNVWTNETSPQVGAAFDSSAGTLPSGKTDKYTVVFKNGSAVDGEAQASASTTALGEITISWVMPSGMSGDTVSIYGRGTVAVSTGNNTTYGLIVSGLPSNNGSATAPYTGDYVDTGAITPTASQGPPVDNVTVTGGTGPSSTSLTVSEPLYQTGGSGTTMFLFGLDLNATSSVYTDTDMQYSGSTGGAGCSNNATTALFGNVTPQKVLLTGQSSQTVKNAALGLEAAPPEWSGHVTYPSIGAGWLDKDGAQLATQDGVFGNTTLTFGATSTRTFSSTAEGDVYGAGTAVGEYADTAATWSTSSAGMVVCSVAELEAINSGTGPDVTGAPFGFIPYDPLGAGHIGQVNVGGNDVPETLQYCDGAPQNPYNSSEGTAFNELIVLELSPTAFTVCSDGSPLEAIWQIQGTGKLGV